MLSNRRMLVRLNRTNARRSLPERLARAVNFEPGVFSRCLKRDSPASLPNYAGASGQTVFPTTYLGQ